MVWPGGKVVWAGGKMRVRVSVRACVCVHTYMCVLTPSFPNVVTAMLKIDLRASTSISSHAISTRIMSRFEIMLFGHFSEGGNCT